MTKGKYSLIVNDDGKDVSIIDEFYRKKESKVWSSGTGTKYTWQSVWRWHFLLENRWKRFLSYWMIFLSVLMKNGRKKHFASLMELGKEQQIFLFTCHERTMKLAEEAGREENTGEFIQLRNGCISKESDSIKNNLTALFCSRLF